MIHLRTSSIRFTFGRGNGGQRFRSVAVVALAFFLFVRLCSAAELHPPARSHSTTDPVVCLKSEPRWHTIIVVPSTNLPPIHFYNKINPVWWFGNLGEPHAPDWYRPNGKHRDFMWHLRNPFSNFTSYVIGVADKETVRSGYYPERVGNPRQGWNFAVTRRRFVFLPFIDYSRGRFEFYFGWRRRGSFGIKLNFGHANQRQIKAQD